MARNGASQVLNQALENLLDICQVAQVEYRLQRGFFGGYPLFLQYLTPYLDWPATVPLLRGSILTMLQDVDSLRRLDSRTTSAPKPQRNPHLRLGYECLQYLKLGIQPPRYSRNQKLG